MLIGGVQKTTLLDYPGKVACLLFTVGCNLRCGYCHNSNFVLPEAIRNITDMIPEDVFFRFLDVKKLLLDGVVICGGEPTLQKDLIAFCQKIKKMGLLVKLDTNGQNPLVLRQLLEAKLVDYIAMDIKCDLDNGQDLLGVGYEKQNYLESIEIIKNANIEYEFRTTLVKNYHTQEKFVNLLKPIVGAKCYFLQNYRPGKTLQKDFAGESFSSNELLEFKNIAVHYISNTFIRL